MIIDIGNCGFFPKEKYLDSDGEKALRSYLKFNMGYIDGFYPFCDNLPDNIVGEKSDSDDWGEPNFMEKLGNEDYSLEDIVDMPVESDLVSENKSVDVDTFPMNPVKTITIKKKTQNREKPKILRFRNMQKHCMNNIVIVMNMRNLYLLQSYQKSFLDLMIMRSIMIV